MAQVGRGNESFYIHGLRKPRYMGKHVFLNQDSWCCSKASLSTMSAYEPEHLLVGLGFLVEGQGIGPGG